MRKTHVTDSERGSLRDFKYCYEPTHSELQPPGSGSSSDIPGAYNSRLRVVLKRLFLYGSWADGVRDDYYNAYDCLTTQYIHHIYYR